MNITKYQKLFGVGPLGLLISLILLALLWLIDRDLGGVQISTQARPVRIIDLILIGAWICWHLWATMTIKRWWFHDHLCTTGPFRIVRHPIYSGSLLLACPGVSLLLNSWIVLLLPVIMYPILSILVRKEEAMMTAIFGKQYTRYAVRIGRLIPRFWCPRP